MAVNVSNVPGFSAQLGIKINFSSSNVKKEAQPLEYREAGQHIQTKYGRFVTRWHRRRIKTEEKAKVVASVGGRIYSIPCPASCFA